MGWRTDTRACTLNACSPRRRQEFDSPDFIFVLRGQIVQGERRPSLRSLKHRLNQQENFSSADEEEEEDEVHCNTVLSASGSDA